MIAQHLLDTVGWGTKLRLYVGATLSMVDMSSDLYVAITFLAVPGLRTYGLVLLVMLGLNLFLQVIVTCVVRAQACERASELACFTPPLPASE